MSDTRMGNKIPTQCENIFYFMPRNYIIFREQEFITKRGKSGKHEKKDFSRLPAIASRSGEAGGPVPLRPFDKLRAQGH
jgi:hypothetical protein